MNEFPPLPDVESAPPELFAGGHLWLQELVDGVPFRFRLREPGVLRFGDRDRDYPADEIPMPYRHAVRHVRERLDRAALRDAVDDVESVAFFGVATTRRAIEYDWDRTPSFLGVDVWSGADDRFLPPDAVERAYAGLGLEPVNAFAKEVRAVDFDPDAYELPRSRWYDGAAAGVLVRNKTGLRAKRCRPAVRAANDPEPVDAAPAELARRCVTRRRVDAAAAALEAQGRPVAFDGVYDRVLEQIAREERRPPGESAAVDAQAFRSAAAARTRQLLDRR